MLKRNKIKQNKLERFKFKPVSELKKTLKNNPNLSIKLREDFTGTLKTQGITLNKKTIESIRTEWRTQIKTDIRKVAETAPKKDQWYLSQVLAEKPIKLRVKIDKEKGQHIKTLRRNK